MGATNVAQVLASLWALYNTHVSEGNPAVTDGEQTLWAPSETRKGGNAAELAVDIKVILTPPYIFY